MDVLDAIFTRRCIRKFTGEQVSEEDLKTILKAGFSAPSAHNYRPQHFVVVREKSSLEDIASFHPYGKMLPGAGCGIIVCGDSEKQNATGFLVADCSASIQNMLLAAHGLGLGAVWCGLYPHDKLTEPMSQLLKLPKAIIPVGIVALGHKAQVREAPDRYEDTKVHFEQW
jgi:nitroreductase